MSDIGRNLSHFRTKILIRAKSKTRNDVLPVSGFARELVEKFLSVRTPTSRTMLITAPTRTIVAVTKTSSRNGTNRYDPPNTFFFQDLVIQTNANSYYVDIVSFVADKGQTRCALKEGPPATAFVTCRSIDGGHADWTLPLLERVEIPAFRRSPRPYPGKERTV